MPSSPSANDNDTDTDTDSFTTTIDMDDVLNVNFDDTLPFDSQFPPSSLHGEEDCIEMDIDGQYLENTVPFDDDDALETQLVDVAGETQDLCIAGETQQLSIAGETQVLDDIEYGEDDDTQLLDAIDEEVSIDSHSDGTNGNYILENGNEPLSDHILSDPGEKKLVEKTDYIISEQNSSGTRPTSVRIVSLREAAHKMSLKRNKDGTNLFTGVSQSQEPLTAKDKEEPFLGCRDKTTEYDHGQHRGEANEDFDKDEPRVASSVVRKLFNDDLPAEKEGCYNNRDDGNGEESLTKLSIYTDELAGLSYVNSQEPGELTQAAALDVVDKLLKDNDVLEFNVEDNLVNHVQKGEKGLPSLKGQQSLAKIVNGGGNARKAGVYDWDDSREDEGGGDIFLRRKDEFFEGAMPRRKSLPAVLKIEVSRSDGSYNNDNVQSTYDQRRKVQSDSRLKLHNKVRDGTVKDAAKDSKRSLISDLDELFENNRSRAQLYRHATAADAKGMIDVGLDTQMAAEAMEALCDYEGSDNNVTTNEAAGLADQPNDSCLETGRGVTSKKPSGKNNRIHKRVKSDLQNSSSMKEHNVESREQCKRNQLMRRTTRSMTNVEDNLITGASENMEKCKTNQLMRRSTRSMTSVEDNLISGASENREQCKRNKLMRRSTRSMTNVEDNLISGASENREQCKRNQLMRRTTRSMTNVEDNLISGASENCTKFPSQFVGKRTSARTSKRLKDNELLDCTGSKGENGGNLVNKWHLQSEIFNFSPVARRTRRSLVANRRKRERPSRSHTEEDARVDSPERKNINAGFQASKTLVPKSKRSRAAYSEGDKNTLLNAVNKGTKRDALDHPRRSLRTLSSHNEVSERLVGSSNSSALSEDVGLSADRKRKMRTDDSSRGSSKSSELTSATPDKCKTPVNEASPVCMGDNYYKQSCNKDLRRELCFLTATGLEFTPSKDSRKRRDMTDVRILYSQHLDENIIKHQKKILARLGVSVVTSILDATHFIADKFVRTRNMLEAIASGKPVVTHLWIDSCGQTNCLIDEKNYILRDAKKEKEFGFSMPVSLALATRHPLLAGRRVLITPNTKPSKEIISHLVKALQGQAMERIGRSSVKDDKIQDLLILSCEDDYALCVPFIEKGTAVYSSELLLNGIVTQTLEYERHRLFADNVKKTRSTIWLKDGETYRAVNKCK